jgi:uncharacterized protein (TIGR02246 family)
MRKRISLASLVLLVAAGVAWLGWREFLPGPQGAPALAQAPGEEPAADAAIRKAAHNYAEAFNRGDLDGLLAIWAADADYVDSSGATHKGKAALGALFRQSMEHFKGHKLSGQITAIRFLKPDVAVEDGTLEFTGPEGVAQASRYTAVWTKKDGRWLISSARDVGGHADGAAPSSYQRLRELEWLVGDWRHADGEDKLALTVRWALNKGFLVVEYQVRTKEGDPLDVTQWVGWDPLQGGIRSWFFDSHGGHGVSDWTRAGNTWKLATEGVTPDGRIGRSVNVVKFIDEGAFLLQLTDRQVDDHPLPDIEARLVRKRAK